ncbi:MAG: phosphonate ABC transporter, permease protein PhnE, partial [Candidatus Zophobacter franzmannii]|nr:phosphonate ABC transporter, permease protein PhnE [Candidatus Zophobacter franzmannii]
YFSSTALLVLTPTIILSAILMFTKSSIGYRIFIREDSEDNRGGYWVYIIPLIIMTFYTGWIVVEINPVEFFTQFKNSGNIFNGLLNPNFEKITPMLGSLAETVFLAFMATVFAIPIAFVLSFFAARNLMSGNAVSRGVYFFIRNLATIFRSIEAVVWAIIFSVWVGIGPFAGMLALMTHSIASLVKLYSEQIENIDWGQVEAIKATGASTPQVWIYAIIPQIISPYLAFTIYRWDINVRMATIVGFVGGGGIGLALMQEQQMLSWRNVGLIMWLIAIVVWLMDMISAKVREKLLES